MTADYEHQDQTERYRRMTEILFKYESIAQAAMKHFSIEEGSSIHISLDDMAFFRAGLGIPPSAYQREKLVERTLPESRL